MQAVATLQNGSSGVGLDSRLLSLHQREDLFFVLLPSPDGRGKKVATSDHFKACVLLLLLPFLFCSPLAAGRISFLEHKSGLAKGIFRYQLPTEFHAPEKAIKVVPSGVK